MHTTLHWIIFVLNAKPINFVCITTFFQCWIMLHSFGIIYQTFLSFLWFITWIFVRKVLSFIKINVHFNFQTCVPKLIFVSIVLLETRKILLKCCWKHLSFLIRDKKSQEHMSKTFQKHFFLNYLFSLCRCLQFFHIVYIGEDTKLMWWKSTIKKGHFKYI